MSTPATSTDELLRSAFDDALSTLRAFMEAPDGFANVRRFADLALETVRADGVLMACGNGGSMSDAMHFAEEWTGRFRGNRRPIPAIAFSDPAALTCIANDFGYDEVFARQVEGLGKNGDMLVALSTSGKSPSIVRALDKARACGLTTVGLLGPDGSPAEAHCDLAITFDASTQASHVQEMHLVIIHAWLTRLDAAFA